MVGDWRNGDHRVRRGVGLVQQVEQPRGGFDEVAAFAEICVSRDITEPDQIFAFVRLGRVEAERFRRGLMAGHHSGCFNFA